MNCVSAGFSRRVEAEEGGGVGRVHCDHVLVANYRGRQVGILPVAATGQRGETDTGTKPAGKTKLPASSSQ